MRVARRTRPSQVGCAGSIARRRLFHAFGSPPEMIPHQKHHDPMAGATMVIQLAFPYLEQHTGGARVHAAAARSTVRRAVVAGSGIRKIQARFAPNRG